METDQLLERKDNSQELDSSKDEQLDKIASEIQARVIENPELLERMLDKPEIMAIAIAHESFRGPVPSPKMLSEYEEIVPGLADRLVKLAEAEQQFRHDISTKALDFSYFKDRRGQWMGFLLSAAVLASSFFFAMQGKDALAGTLITLNLVGLASVFAIGHLKKTSKEDE